MEKHYPKLYTASKNPHGALSAITTVLVEKPYSQHPFKMLIYYPANPRGDGACILSMHAGGFFEGARNDQLQRRIALAFIKKGFIVASADYRLGLRDQKLLIFKLSHAYLDAIKMAAEDCSAAFAYLRAYSYVLHINKNKIILAGSSAGAIAALQAGFSSACCFRNRPAAIVAFAGAALRTENGLAPFAPSPTLLVAGTNDKVVNFYQSRVSLREKLYGSKTLREAIIDKGGQCRAIWFEGAEHEVSMAMPKMADEVEVFIDDALRLQTLEEKTFESDVRYCELDLSEEAKIWHGKTALGLLKGQLKPKNLQ